MHRSSPLQEFVKAGLVSAHMQTCLHLYLTLMLTSITSKERKMRHLGKFCAAVVLTCAFSLSTYAGEISCPGITASQPTAAGYIPNGVTDTLILLLVALV